jgi:hypothetical protein
MGFLRTITLIVYETTGVLEKKTPLINNEDNNQILETNNSLKVSYIVISIMGIIFFVISFILLCIDLSTCNQLGPRGAQSICTDQLYCCAIDVISPPGIIEGCPWIQSCSGLDPPVYTSDLRADPYFIWNFVLNIIIIITIILHLIVGNYDYLSKPTYENKPYVPSKLFE